jgi:hypothetical protein
MFYVLHVCMFLVHIVHIPCSFCALPVCMYCTVAELRTKKSSGTEIADLQNLTSASPQLSAVSCQFRYFLVPFLQLRMVLKINQKYL